MIIRIYKELRYLKTQEELIKYLRKDYNFLIRAKSQNKYKISNCLNI